MSERLTDEQVHWLALGYPLSGHERAVTVQDIATELLALRAAWKIAQPFLPDPVYRRCLSALKETGQ